MIAFAYPCTGHVSAEGFGAFLEAELGAPRRNLHAFARELAVLLEGPSPTLVNSGSSANLAAACALAEVLRARGGPLRAVISAFTFPTTASALSTAGFDIEVVDVDERGFGIDAARVREGVGLVAVTHFLGWPSAVPRPRGALVLQDACETMTLRIDGAPVHRLADATTYSFYHPHHLSSYGGGAVVTHDRELARVVESVAHWGRACTHHLEHEDGCAAPDGPEHQFTYVRRGFNLEMSELNACFGRFALRRFAEDEARRVRFYALLHDALAGVSSLQTFAPPEGGTPFVFPVVARDGDARPLVDRLRARGVEARTWMGGAIVDQAAYRDLPHDGVPRARALSRRGFFVGCHPTLSEEQVRATARIVAEEAR